MDRLMVPLARWLADVWRARTGAPRQDMLARCLAGVAGLAYLGANLRLRFLVSGLTVGGVEVFLAVSAQQAQLMREKPRATTALARLAATLALGVDLWRHLSAHLPVCALVSVGGDILFSLALYVLALPTDARQGAPTPAMPSGNGQPRSRARA